MLLKCLVVLLCFVHGRGQEIGAACTAEGNTGGTCDPLNRCLFAYRQIQNYIQPKICGWQDNKSPVVCCPKANIAYTTGQLRKFFDSSSKGILHSRDMTCRYSGELPMLCCENRKDTPPPPEPKNCPPLDPPPTKPRDIAYEKCLEYRRHVEPCVEDGRTGKLVREDACGIKQFEDRIYEGTPADPNEFPHMALLGCRNEVDPIIAPLQWVAGGTLISDKFILTAGHVLSHTDYGQIRYALLGTIDKRLAQEGVLYNVVNALAHKLYQRNYKPHDIALLELDRRVEFSEFIRPACLPSPGLEAQSTTRTLAGWGQTATSIVSDILMKVYVAELDYEKDCKPLWTRELNRIFMKDTMLCAGSTMGKKGDSCPGDSGGPLMALAQGIHCTYIVQGVVSFGPGCSSGQPGIYTNVRAYLPWIIENVWGNKTRG